MVVYKVGKNTTEICRIWKLFHLE